MSKATHTSSFLVLLPCSAAKRRIPKSAIAARDRYNGPFFKIVRKCQREGKMKDGAYIAILSAKYGLINESTQIPFYDVRMTPKRADKLRLQVRSDLQKLIRDRSFNRIYVNLGRDYAAVVRDLPALRGATWAAGPIGKRSAALKRWICCAR